MSDLVGNHIVGYPTRWLIYCQRQLSLGLRFDIKQYIPHETIQFLAHQTEIATLFAWVIKLHPTQVFSPMQKKKKNTQNLEINQSLGVVVQEKESNMVFCSRWKFSTLGMTVLSATSASLGSAQHGHPLGWKLPSRTEPHIRFL